MPSNLRDCVRGLLRFFKGKKRGRVKNNTNNQKKKTRMHVHMHNWHQNENILLAIITVVFKRSEVVKLIMIEYLMILNVSVPYTLFVHIHCICYSVKYTIKYISWTEHYSINIKCWAWLLKQSLYFQSK